MRISLLLVSVVAAIAASIHTHGAAAQTVTPAEQNLVGTWGSDRISVASTAGSIRIQVDCVVATADEAIHLDKSGRFAVTLTFVPVRGVVLDGSEGRPASHVSGRLDKDVLHVTVMPDGTEAAGMFTLRKNAKPKLPNCRLRS